MCMYVYIYIIIFILYAFHNSDSCLDQTGYCEAIWVPVAVVAAISLAVLFFFSFDTLEYQARSNDWRDGGCVLRRLVSGFLVVMH